MLPHRHTTSGIRVAGSILKVEDVKIMM